MATAKGGGRRSASCSCEKIVARVPEAGLLVLGRSSRHASDFLDALAKPGRILDAPFLPLCEKSGLKVWSNRALRSRTTFVTHQVSISIYFGQSTL